MFVGLSGFLLVGGTVLVFSVDRTIREFWLSGGTLREWAVLHAKAEFSTRMTWAFYVVTLIGAIGWALRSRRASTVVYQITPSELESLLLSIFERLDLKVQRRGAKWLWSANQQATRFAELRSVGADKLEWLSVDGSELMRVAVISWSLPNSPSRQDVEAELCRSLLHVRVQPSPVGVWFLTGTTVIFMATALLLGTMFFGSGH